MFESNFPVEKMGIGWAALWNAFKRMAAGASAERSRRCSAAPRAASTGWIDMTMRGATHQGLILDQFTRQATPFSTATPDHRRERIADDHRGRAATPQDTVLDVACGGGIVVCAFAPQYGMPPGST